MSIKQLQKHFGKWFIQCRFPAAKLAMIVERGIKISRSQKQTQIQLCDTTIAFIFIMNDQTNYSRVFRLATVFNLILPP